LLNEVAGKRDGPLSELKPTRDGFGDGLVALGEQNQDVVVLSADLSDSVRADWFKKRFPERFFSFGIAEANMVTAGAGFALSGKIPFACTYAVFASGRAWEPIRNVVCYSNANVKIAASHAGLTVGPDGATHQGLEDIALMRTLPGMTVIVPCDYHEAKKATMAAAAINGPVYLRFSRDKSPVLTTPETPFELGKALVLREGRDLTFIACGILVAEAMRAAEDLARDGIEARVINMHTIKPLDTEAIARAARETGVIVTAEEHQLAGGLGSAVTEVTAALAPVPVERVGVKDQFGESGEPSELLALHGLTAKDMVAAARRALARRASPSCKNF
jgi:transketolase